MRMFTLSSLIPADSSVGTVRLGSSGAGGGDFLLRMDRAGSKDSLAFGSAGFEEVSEEGEEEGKEDEGLVGELQVAAATGGRVESARRPVVVLGGEDEGREPEIGEDEVGKGVVELVEPHHWGDEGWDPEEESEGTNDHLKGEM